MAKRIDRYEVVADGMTITAVRVPVEGRDYGWGDVRQQKSLFAVTVDGAPRGRLQLPTGFGTCWEAWSLGRVDIPTWDNDRPRMINGRRDGRRDQRPPQEVLADFAAAVRKGLAPTAEEIAAFVLEKEERRRRDDEATAARIRREDERRRREDDERCKLRAERLETLKGLRQRLSAQLTNAETAALVDVIQAIEAEIEHERARREAFGG